MSFDPHELAVAGVQGLSPYEPGKAIETLAREHGVDPARIVKLASNENPRGPSPRAIAAAREVLDGVHRYPDGNGAGLREALARRHGVDGSTLTLGNGSNDVLDMVARTFLGPGRNAVCSRHAFAVYPIATRIAGAELRVAEAFAADHPTAPYGHDLEAMARLVDEDTRVVFVANPNNPTGTWIGGTELDRFLARMPDHVIVVLDEAYSEYVGEREFPDGLSRLDDHPNLVVTHTFSKIHGLAGLRCGYALSTAAVADLLNRARHPFNVNTVALAAAEAALADEAFVATSIEQNRAGLHQLESGVHELGLASIPSVANFLTVDVGGDAGPVYEALLTEGVIVRPVGGYELPHHLRITVGSEGENVRLLQALRNVMKA